MKKILILFVLFIMNTKIVAQNRAENNEMFARIALEKFPNRIELEIGLKVVDLAKSRNQSISVKISRLNQSVFLFIDEILPVDILNWLRRKSNVAKNGAIILDMRTENEYKMGHIDGSINISLGTIRERFTELVTNKTYITCCSHGLKSVKVDAILKGKGFKNVFNGGAWSDFEKL